MRFSVQSINKIFYLILGISLVFFTSCHSDYLAMDYTVMWGAQWNTDHTLAAFVASTKAYKKAKGAAALPDGGIPDYLQENVGLYVFNPENEDLALIVDFNDLAEWIGSSRASWNNKIVFCDTDIYYHILPASIWDKRSHGSKDVFKLKSLKEKYSKRYSVNIKTGKRIEVDSNAFLKFYEKYGKSNKVALTELNEKLSKIPLADWGLVLKDIDAKSDEEYIEETIYLHNSSAVTRRAVVEQIISKLSHQEIKDLLGKMDGYKSKLKGSKKTEYEIYSKDTYERIQKLL